MKNNKNSVRLSGFAGGDPQIRIYGDKKMARLSLGIAGQTKGSKQHVQWFNLVFWNEKVELIESAVQKGTRFSIIGRLVNNSFTDKNNVKRQNTEIVVDTLELL